MKLLRNFLLVAVVGVFIVSCMEDNVTDYVPPTHAEEIALLNSYIDTLENRGLNVDTTSMGVYYVIDSVGEGAFPVNGDTCAVKYTGFYIDGSIFDASGDNTFDVELGNGKVIDGWEDGLKVFNKNSKGYLIIPSEFAYGSTGYSSVPPFTTLIFSIEMVDIKQGS